MDERSGLITVSSSNHHDTLVAGLWNIFKAEHLLDFDLNVGGQSIRAHQLLVEVFLSADIFRRSNQLDHEYHARQNSQTIEAKRPVGGSGIMECLVEFLYKGSVTVAEDQLKDLLDLANELDFKMLIDAVHVAAGIGPDPNELETASEIEGSNHSGSSVVPDDNNDDDWRDKPIKKKARWSKGDKKSAAVGALPPGNKKQRSVRSLKGKKEADTKVTAESRKQIKRKFKIILTSGPGDFDSVIDPEAHDDLDNCNDDDDEIESCSIRKSRRKTVRRKRSSAKSKIPGDPQKVIFCEHCSYKCRSQNRMEMHQAKHNPNVTVHRCELCSRTFLSLEKLAHHQSRHSTNKCPHCEFETPKPTAYYQHLYSRHKVNTEGQPMQQNCPLCEFVCVLPSQLRRHWTRKHTAERPYRCDLCQYSSATKEDVSKHVRRMHLGLKPFSCEICGQCSATRYHLNRHKITHSRTIVDAFGQPLVDPDLEIKVFVCHICGHSCNRQDNLKTHLKTHDKKVPVVNILV